jgi:uncharacterized membrane protein
LVSGWGRRRMKRICGGRSRGIRLTVWTSNEEARVLIYPLAAITHVLAGSVWLGAMVYSLFVLHPQAHRYFESETEFEAFIITISGGARGKVLAALSAIAASGLVLAFVRWPHLTSRIGLVLVGVKVVLFAAALCLFVYTSWRLWPARLFAAPAEIPRFQRVFRRVGYTMITLAVLSMVLGVLLRTGSGGP